MGPRKKREFYPIHIAISEAPLEAGVTQRAMCGIDIPRAAWLWTSMTAGAAGSHRVKDVFAALANARGVMCPRCWVSDWEGTYVYAMIEEKNG